VRGLEPLEAVVGARAHEPGVLLGGAALERVEHERDERRALAGVVLAVRLDRGGLAALLGRDRHAADEPIEPQPAPDVVERVLGDHLRRQQDALDGDPFVARPPDAALERCLGHAPRLAEELHEAPVGVAGQDVDDAAVGEEDAPAADLDGPVRPALRKSEQEQGDRAR